MKAPNGKVMGDKSTIVKTKIDGFGGMMTVTWSRPKGANPLNALWDGLLCGTVTSLKKLACAAKK